MYIFILGKKIKIPIKIFANIIILIFSLFFILGNTYLDRTISFFDRINDNLSQSEEYYLMVLKDAKYNKIEELDGEKIGFYKNESTHNVKEAVETLGKKIYFEERDYDDIQNLFEAIREKEVKAILINASIKNIMNEDYSYMISTLKEIGTINVPIKNNDIVKIVDVTNRPFNIYLIGSDSYGDITKTSNGDVNMIFTINPKTNQILLTSIPRDYYVELYNTNGGMDKLTHASYYGIETAVKTVETLLETDINYYARVNFSTVVKIVDLIGGIEVNSDYSFCDSGRVGCYKKGYNKLNGEQALAFARERKSFNGGDRVRGQNQQKVIKAIIDKVTSSTALISKYSDILSAIEKSFQTNLDDKSITKLVKLQLNKMPSWEIINQSLDGSDSSAYTYSYPKKQLYVMKPNEETIIEAQNKIKEILNAN
ncbi:MAG: LCP family protein [Bacilli bacterium]